MTKNGTNEKIFDFSEDVATIAGASASQVTIEKLLPLKNLAPGAVHVAAEGHGQEPKPDADTVGPIYGNLVRSGEEFAGASWPRHRNVAEC